MNKIISAKAIKTRAFWIEEIRNLSGNFGVDSDRLEKELEAETVPVHQGELLHSGSSCDVGASVGPFPEKIP